MTVNHWHSQKCSATPAQPAPPIAELPQEWQHIIAQVKAASEEDIVTYIAGSAALDHAYAARHIANTVAANLPNDATNANDIMAEKILQRVLQAWEVPTRQARQAIEWRLAKAFAPRLAQCCASKEPRAYRTVAVSKSQSEMESYILRVLEDSLAESAPHPEQSPITNPHICNTAPSLDMLVRDEGANATDPDVDQYPLETYELPTRARLDAFETFHVRKHRSTRNNRDADAQLAEAVSGIWAETIQPRIQQPTLMQLSVGMDSFPHIYSVVEEMVGHKHRVPAPTPRPTSPLAPQSATAQQFVPTAIDVAVAAPHHTVTQAQHSITLQPQTGSNLSAAAPNTGFSLS